MTEPSALLFHPLIQPFWMLLGVILVERLWAWPDKYHPLTFMRLLATNMAKKVHPSTDRSRQQQMISGSLAMLILLVPLFGLLALLINLAEYPLFFDALLLLIALHFQPVVNTYKRVTQALGSEKKTLARDLIQPLVLRETDRLSPMGIAKAAIESLLLRFNYQYCSVLFWYLIAGGVGAFGYRLVFEFSQCWNSKLPRYRYFGKPAAWLCGILVYIPSRIVAGCFAIGENIGGAFNAYRRLGKGSHSHAKLLALKGGALAIQLGGPAYYNGAKIRLAKVGGSREIRYGDLPRALTSIYKTQAVLLVFILLINSSIYALTLGTTY